MHEFFRNHVDSVGTATPAPTSGGDEVEVEVELDVPFPAAATPRAASSPPAPPTGSRSSGSSKRWHPRGERASFEFNAAVFYFRAATLSSLFEIAIFAARLLYIKAAEPRPVRAAINQHAEEQRGEDERGRPSEMWHLCC